MMDKGQMITWKNIGYAAHEIICQCDSDANLEKLAEISEEIKIKMNNLDISKLEKLHTDKGIAVSEYVDMISGSLAKEPADMVSTRNCANALLKIVVDMKNGALRDDKFYKQVAEGVV